MLSLSKQEKSISYEAGSKKIYNIDYVGSAAAGSAADTPDTERSLLNPKSYSE